MWDGTGAIQERTVRTDSKTSLKNLKHEFPVIRISNDINAQARAPGAQLKDCMQEHGVALIVSQAKIQAFQGRVVGSPLPENAPGPA